MLFALMFGNISYKFSTLLPPSSELHVSVSGITIGGGGVGVPTTGPAEVDATSHNAGLDLDTPADVDAGLGLDLDTHADVAACRNLGVCSKSESEESWTHVK